MNFTSRLSTKVFSHAVACLTLLLPAASAAFAQTPSARITSPILNANRVTLAGSHPLAANPAADLGAVSPSMPLHGITLVFSRSPEQQTALDALVKAQQDPKSPQFHQWLSPDQFASRFGVADSDIAATEAWLQQQGFTIDGVSRSRTRIAFSGTAAQVESAFGASLHNYKSAADKTQHFAPSTDLTLPAALASTVLAVKNLSSFRPHTHVVRQAVQPHYTVQGTQAYFLAPPDVATIYDINPAYNQGFTGTGQTIAVIGQSAVVTSDITTFQTLLGHTAKAPGIFLVPDTGTSTVVLGDEGESDLDLEYSSATAPGATVNFYYTGSDQNYGAFDALEYVVDNATATVISSSYGNCEYAVGATNISEIDSILEQAIAQGETFISAAGDTGSSDCIENTDLNSLALETQLNVDYPASSVYALAAGGTEFPTADVTPTNTTYWTSDPGSSDLISSAISYIPEQAWNDDQENLQYAEENGLNPVAAGGGGVSSYEPLPSWQTGVPGIPAGTNRFVPDISLSASPDNAPYVFCSSDTMYYATDQTGSCTSGFSNVSGEYLYYTYAGGTSFVAPQLSALVAIINQAKGYTTGQGLITPTLYTLASNPATYASAFHDTTVGGNECNVGATYCGTGAQTTDYVTNVGYDEATGLGSIDFNNLLTAWPASSGGGTTTISSTTTLTAANPSPALGVADVITIAVASASTSSTTVPTGTVSVSVNGTVVNSSLALTNGTATYTLTEATAGSYVVSATYSGDGVYSASSGSVDVNVGATSFTISVPNTSVASGSSVSGNITITPVNGYTGTVLIGGTLPANLTNACVFGPESIMVTSSTPASASYTAYTNANTCTQMGAVIVRQGKRFVRLGTGKAVALNPKTPAPSPWKRAPLPLAAVALFTLCCFRNRSRLLRGGLALTFLLVLSLGGLGLSGCSSNATASVSSSVDAPAGTYVINVTGTDSVNSALTASTNFTLTVTN